MRAAALWVLLAAPVGAAEVADLGHLPAADIVVLGEIHDNPQHHRNQVEAVTSLRPAAIVFEMLTPAQADLITTDTVADPGLGTLLGWEASGWPDFAMYQSIMLAAPAARFYGAALPEGALNHPDDPALVLPDPRWGLALPLDDADQAAREAEQAMAHCNALPVDYLPWMVGVQRLRDANFAASALDALDETGGPVVVITGSGHARRDQGVPAALALAAPQVTVLTVGQLEGLPGMVPAAPYDLWVITPPIARPDPCAAFGTGD